MAERCVGCGRPQKPSKLSSKAAKLLKATLERRLQLLQKQQQDLENELAACLLEQASVTKQLQSCGR